MIVCSKLTCLLIMKPFWVQKSWILTPLGNGSMILWRRSRMMCQVLMLSRRQTWHHTCIVIMWIRTKHFCFVPSFQSFGTIANDWLSFFLSIKKKAVPLLFPTALAIAYLISIKVITLMRFPVNFWTLFKIKKLYSVLKRDYLEYRLIWIYVS